MTPALQLSVLKYIIFITWNFSVICKCRLKTFYRHRDSDFHTKSFSNYYNKDVNQHEEKESADDSIFEDADEEDAEPQTLQPKEDEVYEIDDFIIIERYHKWNPNGYIDNSSCFSSDDEEEHNKTLKGAITSENVRPIVPLNEATMKRRNSYSKDLRSETGHSYKGCYLSTQPVNDQKPVDEVKNEKHDYFNESKQYYVPNMKYQPVPEIMNPIKPNDAKASQYLPSLK